MKLWLLDADVIIKFLEIDIFDKLLKLHEVHVATTVVGEVKFYYKDGQKQNGKKITVNFREEYIKTGKVIESEANSGEIKNLLNKLPLLRRAAIDPGEIESLAILLREKHLTMCLFVVNCNY